MVIGNDNYQFVSKLQKAGNDAEAVAAGLRAAGFEVILHRDLAYRSMVRATESLYNNIQGGDEVVVFYAGHGVQIKSGNYLLPIDIEATSESVVEKTSYSLSDLSEKLEAAKAAFSLIMVDACRDNPLKTKGRTVGGERGLNPPEPAAGQMVVYSASRGEQALDRLGDNDPNPNSIFTREFIARMHQPGVKIVDMVREIQVSVEKLAAGVGHKQRPALYNEVRGNFYFFAPTTVVIPATVPGIGGEKYETQREDRFWDDAKLAGNRAGFEAYLGQYPNGHYASLARAHLDRLVGATAAKAAGAATAVAPAAQAVASAPEAQTRSTPPKPVVVDKPSSPEPAEVPVKAAAPLPESSSPSETIASPAAIVPELPSRAPEKTTRRLTMPNGDVYEGELVGVTRSGVGRYVFANGDYYEGGFEADQFHGKGTLKSLDGNAYTGDFQRGLKSGQGVYQFANGDRFEGSFVNNLFSGKGVMVLANGDRYEGELLDGLKHGQGVHFFANKDRYEGGFVSGVQAGKGVHFFANGDRFEGHFERGVRHGKGVYRFANGQVLAKEYVNGTEKD
ncbi:MAG: caspase family protein [Comamonadaceae bacterium]|nr:caspase family protein [Comamonadaceae bacterium]